MSEFRPYTPEELEDITHYGGLGGKTEGRSYMPSCPYSAEFGENPDIENPLIQQSLKRMEETGIPLRKDLDPKFLENLGLKSSDS